MLALGFLAIAANGASAEVRSLKLYHLHTGEKADIIFKRDGRYDADGLRKINMILRDWRRNEPTKMDPRLLDLVWQAYKTSGASGYIQVVCGYRSPQTNSMLRSRSRGVAEKSQHMLGRAMDFYIPGVPLKKLRDIGLRMQGGGVGYYPTSGSPFVHMDVGNVRHWPGISRQELVSIFPNGKTLHVPSDGKPLPGYEQALAAYKARKGSGAPAVEMASSGVFGKKRSGGLLAAFFGGGSDDAEDSSDDSGPVVAAAAPPKAKTLKVQPAAKAVPGITIVAPQDAQRAEIPQVAEVEAPKDTPETIIASLPARKIPLPGFAPRPKADVGVETADNVPVGSAETTGATEQVAAATALQPPADIPFGMADATAADAPQAAAAADPVQVAVNNIPLPTWRPERSTPPELAVGNQDSVLLALADTAQHGQTATDATNAIPTARPDAIKAVLEEANATDEYQVASLETPTPAPRSIFTDPAAEPATPRKAARAVAPVPASAIAASVKTTRKEARASARDSKPEPKPIVVAAEPSAARWALTSNEQVASISKPTTGPRYAYNIVHTRPSEVYTDGFLPEGEVIDPSRFSGKAVKFLSVARFKSK